MTVRIVTDSTAYLSPELVRELDIIVVPFHVHIGDQVYIDGIDLDEDAFAHMVYEQGLTSRTSSPTVQEFHRAYERLAQETSEEELPTEKPLFEEFGTVAPDEAPADEAPPGDDVEILWLTEPRTDDLDAMIERRMIRALVVPNRTEFFLDGATTRGVAVDMIRRGSGRIINLVGGGFNRATKHMSAYAVSKTAIMRLTEIMALELQEHGVTTFAFSPGSQGPEFVNNGHPLGGGP